MTGPSAPPPAPPALPPANRRPPRPRATRSGQRGRGPRRPYRPRACCLGRRPRLQPPGHRETRSAPTPAAAPPANLPSPLPGPCARTPPSTPSLPTTRPPAQTRADSSAFVGPQSRPDLWPSLVWPTCKACPWGLPPHATSPPPTGMLCPLRSVDAPPHLIRMDAGGFGLGSPAPGSGRKGDGHCAESLMRGGGPAPAPLLQLLGALQAHTPGPLAGPLSRIIGGE